MGRPCLMNHMQFLVLAALMRCPMHSYAIWQDVIELTRHRVRVHKSTVQRAVRNLARAGFIQDCSDPYYWINPRHQRRGAVYELSQPGRAKLLQEFKTREKILDMVSLELERQAAAEAKARRQRLRDYLSTV